MNFGRLPALPVVTLRKACCDRYLAMTLGAATKAHTPFRTEQFPVCSEFLPSFEFEPQSLRQKFSSKKGKVRPATEMSEVPMHTANTLPLCLDQRVLERTCLERKRCGAARCFIFIFRHETKTGFQGWINGPCLHGSRLLLTLDKRFAVERRHRRSSPSPP